VGAQPQEIEGARPAATEVVRQLGAAPGLY